MKKFFLILFLTIANFAFSQNFWKISNPIAVHVITSNPSSHVFVGYISYSSYPTGFSIGVLKSTNDGSNWMYINNGLTDLNMVGLYYTTTGTLLAGTHSNGIFYSTNEGNTWIQSSNTSSVITGFTNYNNNFFAAFGFYCEGVRRSTDNGANWVSVNNGIGSLCVNKLAVTSTGTIFAATGTNGVSRSTNSGNQWVVINNGLTNMNLSSIIVNTNGYVFVGSVGGGVFRSTNNGDTWSAVNNGITTNKINEFARNSSGVLFAASSDHGGVFKSTNNGDLWTQVNSGLLDTNFGVGTIAATNNGYLYSTAHNNLYRTVQPTFIKVEKNSIPNNYILHQNYPNPFNPVTYIEFAIPKLTNTKISVYDVTGKEVYVLVEENLHAGYYEVEWDANSFSSGVYFYKIEAGDFVQTKKMILLK